MGDALFLQQTSEPRARQDVARCTQPKLRPGAQGHDHFPNRDVEIQRGKLKHPAVGLHVESLSLGGSQIFKSPVGDENPFGPAG